jgi:hypothetical protein
MEGWSKTNGELLIEAARREARRSFWCQAVLFILVIGCAIKFILS